MKKILFLGILEGEKNKNGGYLTAAFSFLNSLKELKKENYIEDLVILDLNQIYSLNENEIYDLGIIFINPNSLLNKNFFNILKYKFKNVKKVYLNILWETIFLPKKWEVILKDDFISGFIVSSHFLFSLVKYHTNKPIYYIPYFFEEENFSLVDLNSKQNEEKFTVLFVGQNTERKGLKECILSFILAFYDNPNAQLLIKSFNLNSQEEDIENLIKKLIILNSSNTLIQSKIFLIEEELSFEQMKQIYNFSSCLCFPSKGEGFGLPIAEAMLSGLPVIYTYNTASIEVGRSNINIPIECFFDLSSNMAIYGYEKGTFIFDFKLKDLVYGLKKLYNLWEKNKKEYYLNSSKN